MIIKDVKSMLGKKVSTEVNEITTKKKILFEGVVVAIDDDTANQYALDPQEYLVAIPVQQIEDYLDIEPFLDFDECSLFGTDTIESIDPYSFEGTHCFLWVSYDEIEKIIE